MSGVCKYCHKSVRILVKYCLYISHADLKANKKIAYRPTSCRRATLLLSADLEVQGHLRSR